MRFLAFALLFFPTLLTAQITSKTLTCDCFIWTRVPQANGSLKWHCHQAAQIPFKIQFNGARATLTMRQYDYDLRYHTAWVDPSGIRNSTYIKQGEIGLDTTYPLAENFVSVFTHPDEKLLTQASCRQ